MRRNLLEFLFGEEVVPKETDALGEHIVKIFEEADELESVEMVADKKPLEAALSAIGIKSSAEPNYQMAEVHFANGDEYREAVRLLSDPENMHKLAVAGWVATRGDGDIAMVNEPADYKLNFVEISVASDLDNEDKSPDLEKVIKKGQEFDTTPEERDNDEMNPVDNERSNKKGEKQAGIGKESDGDKPKGTPKGSKKTEESVDSLLPAPDLTECGCENLGSKRKQAPFFRTDKNLANKPGKKKNMESVTMASAVPAVEAPMATGKTWKEKLERQRKRRDPDGIEGK